MKRSAFVVAVSVAALVPWLGFGASDAGATTTTTVVVGPSELISTPPTGPGQFVAIDNGDGSGSVGLVAGPGVPPLGVGSLQLSTTGTGSHWTVYNYDWMGTPLSALTTLGYSTFTTSSTTDPALQIEIDPGNTTGTDAGVTYSTLNFEPYLNGTVTPGTWQDWNVLNGKVWGTHLTGAPMSSPVTWSEFLALYPNATVKYGLGVNVGSGWSTPMTGNVDALSVGTAAGTTTYNFEPVDQGHLPFASVGAGTEVAGSSGCQSTPEGCTVTASGWSRSLHLGKGTFTSSLSIDWAAATSNGAGGYCAPASGTSTIVAANGAELDEIVAGTVCEVGPTGSNVPHVFNGTYAVVGGTGRFANATGEGSVVANDDGQGNEIYSETGSLTE